MNQNPRGFGVCFAAKDNPSGAVVGNLNAPCGYSRHGEQSAHLSQQLRGLSSVLLVLFVVCFQGKLLVATFLFVRELSWKLRSHLRARC
jgi:hypothetical protein